MSDQIVLNAETRERTGSNKARVIRKVDGMVPAIVYGDKKEVHLRISLPIFVFGGAGSRDQGGIHDRALAHRHSP